MKRQRLVVGISGGSGAILGIRLLEALRPTPIETHLVITPSARLTIEHETHWQVNQVLALANQHYNPRDLAAPIASGSFQTIGMVIIPCSIKSLSAVANSYSGDLLIRAADVTLKEGRTLLLVVREAPLHAGHIRLMELAAQAGAVLFPPVPAFYAHPQSVDEIVNNIVGRVLFRLGVENDLYLQWKGGKTDDLPSETIVLETGRTGELEPAADSLWSLPAMTMATSGPDGAPHAAPVYFVADESHENLYFFSGIDSQHSHDLADNQRAATAIYPLVEGWQEIRGLQMRGRVRPVPNGPEWEKAWRLYLVKFPFVEGMKEIVEQNRLYSFQPDWTRWLDNRRGFGFKEEWTYPR